MWRKELTEGVGLLSWVANDNVPELHQYRRAVYTWKTGSQKLFLCMEFPHDTCLAKKDEIPRASAKSRPWQLLFVGYMHSQKER
jgi:hypothetical protein